jgi:hypothetical protein
MNKYFKISSYKKIKYDSKMKDIKLNKVDKNYILGLKQINCSGLDCIDPYKKEVD